MDIKKPQLVKVEAFVHFFQLFIGKDVLQHLLQDLSLGVGARRAETQGIR